MKKTEQKNLGQLVTVVSEYGFERFQDKLNRVLLALGGRRTEDVGSIKFSTCQDPAGVVYSALILHDEE